MAYKKFTKKYSKKSYGRRKFDSKYGSLAYKAYKGMKFIKSVINPEQKFVDNTVVANVGTTAVVNHLTNIAVGDDENTRNGNSVRSANLLLRGALTLNVNSTTTPSIGRFILFIDTMNQGTAPTAAQVLQTVSWSSPLNADNAGRFQVLMDKTYTVDNTGGRVVRFDKYFKIQHHVHWSSGVATDTRQGNIYLIRFSTDNTNQAGMEFYSRYRYYDN